MKRDIQIGSLLRGIGTSEFYHFHDMIALVIDVDQYGFITLQIVHDTQPSRRIHKTNLADCWEVIA